MPQAPALGAPAPEAPDPGGGSSRAPAPVTTAADSRGGGAVEGAIAVVSRERILREAAAARRLREAEEEMTARLQGQIDETKAAFAAEEAELAQLRDELPEAEFESRVAAFDERVRLARRNAQERAAALQKTFQDARAAIVAALPALMERLRVEAGASVVVNADEVLALDPAFDLTDRAIALFDAEGPSPEPPQLDFSAPLSRMPAATTSPGQGGATAPGPGAAGRGRPGGATDRPADPASEAMGEPVDGPAGDQPPAR